MNSALAPAVRRLPGRVVAHLPTLALALLLPALLALAAWLPLYALAALDGDNLAVAWVDGDAQAQQRARRAATADRTFAGDARRARAGEAPPGCAADASRLEFVVRRIDQAPATRAALQAHADASGARVCAGGILEMNVPPSPAREPGRWLRAELWQAIVLGVLPLGLVAIGFVAPFGAVARRRLRAELPTAWQRPLLHAAAAAIVAATVLAYAGILAPGSWLPPASGVSPLFALHELWLMPLLHQLATRTWLFALLAPRWPAPAVVALSVLAATVAATPMTAAAALAAAALAAACTALYLRTRTLLPATLLHAVAVALQDAWLVAG